MSEKLPLKPCPFCCGEAYLAAIRDTGFNDDGYKYTTKKFYAACSGCKACTTYHTHEDTARQDWNRRFLYGEDTNLSLKRCPLCGGEAHDGCILSDYIDDDGKEHTNTKYFVVCSKCKIRTKYDMSKCETHKNWNRRTEEKKENAES